MRVITGTARGARLKTLEGLDTRPTTDKVKESVFNIIQFDIPGREVLDLFAGSGQMAIEALSRGAAGAVLVDSNRAAMKVISENLQKTRLDSIAQVVSGDYQAYLRSCRRQFDVIFLDPPYASDMLENSLKLISEFDILSSGGIIVCERPIDGTLPDFVGDTWSLKDYRYGKTVITVLSN